MNNLDSLTMWGFFFSFRNSGKTCDYFLLLTLIIKLEELYGNSTFPTPGHALSCKNFRGKAAPSGGWLGSCDPPAGLDWGLRPYQRQDTKQARLLGGLEVLWPIKMLHFGWWGKEPSQISCLGGSTHTVRLSSALKSRHRERQRAVGRDRSQGIGKEKLGVKVKQEASKSGRVVARVESSPCHVGGYSRATWASGLPRGALERQRSRLWSLAVCCWASASLWGLSLFLCGVFQINLHHLRQSKALCRLQVIYEGRNTARRSLRPGEGVREEMYTSDWVCVCVRDRQTDRQTGVEEYRWISDIAEAQSKRRGRKKEEQKGKYFWRE